MDNFKGETHTSITISTDSSAVIQRWIKENNLIHNGNPWTLPRAIRMIAEDFADVLIKEDSLLLREQEEIEKQLQ